MILHEPFVNVEPLYTTMDIDLPRPLLLSSLQPSVLPEFTQRKQGPLSQIPLSFQQTNITKCCKRYIILYIYDKKNKIKVENILNFELNTWLFFRIKKSYSNSDKWENGTILTIEKVTAKEHQGNYTCAPSTLTASSVVVHIIDEGKMPQDAAVYDSFDSSSSKITLSSSIYIYLLSSIILIGCYCSLFDVSKNNSSDNIKAHWNGWLP